MIHHKAKAYKHSTRAAGLAAVTLSEYTNFLLLETLVEPVDAAPKSNRSNKHQSVNQKQTRVYPNPTSGILLVEVPGVDADVILHVLDNSGRSIQQVEGSSGINHLNLRPIAPGHYVLHIQSKDGGMNESHSIQILK